MRILPGGLACVCVLVSALTAAQCGGRAATSPSPVSGASSVATAGAGSSGGGSGGVSSPQSCSYDSAVSGSHCGCAVSTPLDLTSAGTIDLWPFGVHAQSGHTEGHRGLDYSSRRGPLVVTSPVDGTVLSIDNSQDSSGGLVAEFGTNPSVHFTTITADCGLRVVFIPLVLDSGITAGTRVTRGQRLGTLAELQPPYGPGIWSSHVEFDALPSPSDMALRAVCAADLVSGGDRAALEAALPLATYPERFARTVGVACEDGSTAQISFPAENQLCNPRLDAATRNRVAACLPSKANQIW